MALEVFSADEIREKINKQTTSNLNFKLVEKSDAGKMVITSIAQAVRNPNRVNISVNGKYRLSLDIFQLASLNVKVGAEFTEEELTKLEQQSEFGKLYALTLEYCLVRPRSEKEVRDYLWKKTLDRQAKNKRTGEIYKKPGVSQLSVDQTVERLKDKDYINDERFARWWVENRNQRKGTSIRKLQQELQQKGINRETINKILEDSDRNDAAEIKKIIAKKSRLYPDEQKLIVYLQRQGFRYDDIKSVLASD